MHNRRAAIGAAMTWVVATFIILFIVILFIYVSNAMAKERDLKSSEISVLESNEVAGMSSEQVLLGILKTQVGDRSIRNYISQGEYAGISSVVDGILSDVGELDGSVVAYVGDKKVELKGNSLEVTNE